MAKTKLTRAQKNQEPGKMSSPVSAVLNDPPGGGFDIPPGGNGEVPARVLPGNATVDQVPGKEW